MRSSRVGSDACRLSRRWRISPRLADMLVALEARAAQVFSSQGLRWPGVWIISGHRSPRLQASVNPDAPDSLHVRCPAMAADLRVGNLAASTTPDFWPFLGTIWKAMGGRWGGDFKPKPDVNHFEALGITGLVTDFVTPPFATLSLEAPGPRRPAIAPPSPGLPRLTP